MAATRNPYAVLGLAPSADLDAVKRRYRTLARELHPDVAGADSSAAMADVNEAYAILSDPEQRERLHRNPTNDPFVDFFLGRYGDIYNRYLGLYKSNWCFQCGAELHDHRDPKGRDRRADATYCSNACRQKSYRARKAAQKRIEAARDSR